MTEIQRDQASEGSAAHHDRRLDVDGAFDEFVVDGSRRLLRSAYLLTGDRGHAEDLLQVALTRTARQWKSARAAPDAYAHRVLVNLLHDRRRWLSRRVRERPLEEVRAGAPGTRDAVEAFAEREEIIAAVKRLAPRQREVIVLRFWADLSVAETATAIGASPGSVKTHTSRALAKLRKALREPPGDQRSGIPHGE